MSYPIPLHEIETEFEVKKSRFIARADYTPDRAAAMAFLDRARHDFPDARHHCWAYKLGSPQSPTNAAMSDDGEPSGTAGKPIFNVLQHKDIGDIMVIVIRYFGGIKLGAGGLVRAYSAATQQAIDLLPIKTRQATTPVIINCAFSQEQTLRHWLDKHNAVKVQSQYGQTVQLTAELPEDHLFNLTTYITGIGAEMLEPEGSP